MPIGLDVLMKIEGLTWALSVNSFRTCRQTLS